MPSTPPTVSSPCIQVCRLDDAGVCIGCWRTLEEIAQWARLSKRERKRLMEEVLPDRARRAGQTGDDVDGNGG